MVTAFVTFFWPNAERCICFAVKVKRGQHTFSLTMGTLREDVGMCASDTYFPTKDLQNSLIHTTIQGSQW